MSGNEDAMESALKQLKPLAEGVKYSTHEIRQFGVRKYFGSDIGKQTITTIECTLMVILFKSHIFESTSTS